ncbi:hypothetical protein QQF64_016560 [Cirrhinus molitorella]|uniref:Uncharacterized protein n=1 Tax=Cirrhinus molitorella TaxID=172907 RepID=A0ABR3LN50_9TELE
MCRDLHLSTYNTAEDMFRGLENRYGNKSTIALEIIEDLEKIPNLRANQPRKVIDLIQSIEKALDDLTELGNMGAINNPLVIKSIESKLPDNMKRDWLVFMVNPANGVTPDNHFDNLLKFLKTQEEILEKLEQLGVSEKSEKKLFIERKYASTQSTRKGGCVVCGDEKHREKIFFCKRFKELKPGEKLNAVEKLGACKRCLVCHGEDDECKNIYLCRNRECKKSSSPDHHFFLCLKREFKRSEADKGGKLNVKRREFTEDQKKLISELSPEMAERFRRAFTNITAKTNTVEKNQFGVMKLSALKELPVILMLLEVTANAGEKIGTLIDLASDTNYITHKAARRLNLKSENVTLVVHGVGGTTMKVKTRRYFLRVRVKTSTGTEIAHELVCYGLDEIAKVHRAVKPEQLKTFFSGVQLEDLKRPKTIELLISHREGRLAPQRVKVIGNLVLWEGPLGKTVGGAHSDLFEKVDMAVHKSETHFARSMRASAVKYQEIAEAQEFKAETKVAGREFLDWWKWDSIGTACEPKCGGCRCGNCQPGIKEMTLEMHLHRFLWRDTEGGEIEDYAITQVNIGERPAGCIAQLDMRETAKLPEFAQLEEECRILEEDSYVDDILTSHNDKKRLDEITKEIEVILKAGGFFLKPWVRSGQSGRQEHVPEMAKASVKKVLILPNQMGEEDKALGVGYLVEEDKLYPMTSINFSKRKKKMRVGRNLLEEEVKRKTPNPLTRRELLSQVASLYDPIGLITPAKQKGAILVRKAFQEAGSKFLNRDTWDKPLSEKLRNEAIQLFEEYVRLSNITFYRSLTPANWIGRPWGVTFSDGSDRSYGAVVYFRWETEKGVQVRLVEQKQSCHH